MNSLKRFLGPVWMLLGLGGGWYLVVEQAAPRFSSSHPEDLIPALIYAFVLTPIITGGLLVFGWYAWKGAYSE